MKSNKLLGIGIGLIATLISFAGCGGEEITADEENTRGASAGIFSDDPYFTLSTIEVILNNTQVSYLELDGTMATPGNVLGFNKTKFFVNRCKPVVLERLENGNWVDTKSIVAMLSKDGNSFAVEESSDACSDTTSLDFSIKDHRYFRMGSSNNEPGLLKTGDYRFVMKYSLSPCNYACSSETITDAHMSFHAL